MSDAPSLRDQSKKPTEAEGGVGPNGYRFTTHDIRRDRTCDMDGFCRLPAGHRGQHSAHARPVPTTVEISTIQLGSKYYGWRVLSDCGVVKIYSTRDGCITALAPSEARRIAEELASALNEAADCTEVRSYGEVISR